MSDKAPAAIRVTTLLLIAASAATGYGVGCKRGFDDGWNAGMKFQHDHDCSTAKIHGSIMVGDSKAHLQCKVEGGTEVATKLCADRPVILP